MQVSFYDKIMAIAESLESAGIEYAFSGALALGYYVVNPRATRDIDINVAVDKTEASYVLGALPPQIKWKLDAMGIAKATGEVKTTWLRETPVDLFFMNSDFHKVVQSRKEYHPFGTRSIELPFVCATDLAVFKALFDRPKDWVDIDSMLRSQTVDIKEALSWIKRLGSDAQLGKMKEAIANASVPLPDRIEMRKQ